MEIPAKGHLIGYVPYADLVGTRVQDLFVLQMVVAAPK